MAAIADIAIATCYLLLLLLFAIAAIAIAGPQRGIAKVMPQRQPRLSRVTTTI